MELQTRSVQRNRVFDTLREVALQPPLRPPAGRARNILKVALVDATPSVGAAAIIAVLLVVLGALLVLSAFGA